eukprot:10093351-Prorocentrum_lima.AAC.1
MLALVEVEQQEQEQEEEGSSALVFFKKMIGLVVGSREHSMDSMEYHIYTTVVSWLAPSSSSSMTGSQL